jgi:osmoprotectant transport system ATP-binding protein
MYPLEKIEVLSKKDIGEILAPEIMQKQITKISTYFTIEKSILALNTTHASGAPVVDENNKLIGYISESDLLIQVSHKNKSEKILYKEHVHAISEQMNLKDIVFFMSQNKLKAAPVINHRKEVTGLISRMDLLKFIIDFKESY